MITIIPGDEAVYTEDEIPKIYTSEAFKQAILKSFTRCKLCHQILNIPESVD